MDDDRVTFVRQTEQAGAAAWPALTATDYDGWLLQMANGYTRRANSALPIKTSSLPPAQKIDHVERFYRARGLRPRFKMSPAVQPPDLDEMLAARDYGISGKTDVMMRTVFGNRLPKMEDFDTTPEPSEAWFETLFALNDVAPEHQDTARAMLTTGRRVQARFASVYRDGERIGVGVLALNVAYAGLFDVVVAPGHRGQGHGRRMMQGLLHWAKVAGSHGVYLQVTQENTPAQKLYQSLGFETAYSYWYREAPEGA
ncbi:MAG: GNAT family N-acetyltransferase [Chloroflexota bacterium]